VQLLNWFHGLTMIFGLALLVFIGIAFVDAAIRPASAYVAAGKLTKQAWLLILGILFAASFLISLFFIAGIVAALVYFVDVRPALIAVRGGGSSQGPYGPW
jgi:hypothetical protein